MASEISVSATLACTKDTFVLPKHGKSHTIDQTTGGGGVPGMVIVTNAANGVNIETTGITTEGWTYMLNLDAAAYVEWGPVVAGTLHIVGRMEAGEPALFRRQPGVTIALKSSVSSSKVQVVVLED